MPPTLVLTRPAAQSRALAAEFEALARVVISPVMEIVGTGASVNMAGVAGVILTSANAVPFAPDLSGFGVYCVGERTAEAARLAGADVRLVAENADELVARIKASGPLLHLRGAHTRGDIAERLSSDGIETHSTVVYRQEAKRLSSGAKALIEGDHAVVLPLFSPRSAALVGAGLSRVGPRVSVIAISPAVAESWSAETGGSAEVCAHPTATAMREKIAGKLRG